MTFKTADLCDGFSDIVQMAAPIFRDLGGNKTFGRPIATVKVFEDNVLVRRALETAGGGRALVMDGGLRRTEGFRNPRSIGVRLLSLS